MKILLLTGYDQKFAEIGALAETSMREYAARHPNIEFGCLEIPDKLNRHPSWQKVNGIKRWLAFYDYVQWVDADTLILGQQDLAELLQPVTLNIARDANGINCGVMAWRNCPEAFAALERMEAAYERFSAHPWFEQAALMEFVDTLDVAYQPKHIYNAYRDDFCAATLIRHWPGDTNETRLREMRALAAEQGFGPAIL